jgi:creatinine amidohydrolase
VDDLTLRRTAIVLLAILIVPAVSRAQEANPLWQEAKVKNYLPHMSWPEVQDLATRTDMVIIPIASLEQHALHLPIGTDYFTGLERAKLIAQQVDVLVAPILMPGNSPYHMEFPGTITLKAETIQQVYFEAAQSLIRHGFKRFLLLNSHGGNQYITKYVADRINQETAGIAVELAEAAQPYRTPVSGTPAAAAGAPVFDRHAGVGETSTSLYLFPNLVNMKHAQTAKLTLPAHLQKMLPQVAAGDPTAMLVFLAEGLKPKETGKHTSAREMSNTGTWGMRDITQASAEQGHEDTEDFVKASVKFIQRWNLLRPKQ